MIILIKIIPNWTSNTLYIVIKVTMFVCLSSLNLNIQVSIPRGELHKLFEDCGENEKINDPKLGLGEECSQIN